MCRGRGEGMTEEREEICSGTSIMAVHAYMKSQDSPLGKEICLRKWDILVFRGRTCRERTPVASRIQKWTSRIRISGVTGGHRRHDSRGTGKWRYQEGTREQYRGNPDWRMDWTGGRNKEELFSGSERWHQEKVENFCGRLHS